MASPQKLNGCPYVTLGPLWSWALPRNFNGRPYITLPPFWSWPPPRILMVAAPKYWVYTQSLSRIYAIFITYICNLYHVYTQSLSRIYAILLRIYAIFIFHAIPTM